ncbi:MAG: hypothetical protein ABR563_20035, partial [Pyrinomonadaceae bacterium]
MGLRVSMIALCLFFGARAADASTCARAKRQPDAWVASQVDALVAAARASYFGEEATDAAFGRTVVGIDQTMRRCGLARDQNFLDRYREFVGYVAAAARDESPEHELGFVVTDKEYFAETSRYVQIPDFLLDPTFLRNASRYETLGRAKSFLQRLNA